MMGYKKYKPFTKQMQVKNARPDRKKLDKECLKLWQEIVKLKAGNRCEYWGCNKTENLNAHHIFSRSRQSTRYDVLNGLALCAFHHSLGNESAHKDPCFMMKVLGKIPGFPAIRTETWFQALQLRAYTPQKLDLNMELIYLQKTLGELRAREGRGSRQGRLVCAGPLII